MTPFAPVLVAVVLLAAGQPGVVRGQGELPPASVEVAEVRRESLLGGKTFLGTVIPHRRSQVGSAVDGRVEQLLVDVGDPVKAGDPMVQLRIRTISIMLAAAQAEQVLREHEHREMENGSRAEEKDRARAQLAAAKALRAYRESVFQRVRNLYENSRSVSQEEYEQAMQARDVAEQQYLEMVANLDLVMAGPREEQKAQAKARLDMAAEEVHRLEDRREKYTIKAPYDGYVVAKFAEVGQWLKEGDLVTEVVQLDPVEVEVSVPESYIAAVRRGLSARIVVDAASDRVIVGEISRVVPQADLRSRSFPVRILLDNPTVASGPLLKAGMLAHVTLPVGSLAPNGLLVPKDALVLGGPTPMIYVVSPAAGDQPPTARPVSVQLGVAQGAWIQVLGDVTAGQQVVTRGNERLRPGQPLRILATSSPAEDSPPESSPASPAPSPTDPASPAPSSAGQPSTSDPAAVATSPAG